MVKLEKLPPLGTYVLSCPGVTQIPEIGLQVICEEPAEGKEGMLLHVRGQLLLRSRGAGDTITLPGGTKRVKDLLIDRKIPAAERDRLPVFADDDGVAAIPGIGVDRQHSVAPNLCVRLETL